MNADLARRMWWATEPYHATVYFAPETREAYTAVGLKGFWMGYFASRAAPMGPVPPEVVQATFYNFAPGMVARAIPDAWARAAPERIMTARLRAVGDALRRMLGDLDVTEAAARTRAATDGCDPAGRALFAAHASMEWPDEPRLALWHACTLLREFRGDGHVAALLTEGFDGCEAHVSLALTGAVPADTLRTNRGWSEDECRRPRPRRGARLARGAPSRRGADRRARPGPVARVGRGGLRAPARVHASDRRPPGRARSRCLPQPHGPARTAPIGAFGAVRVDSRRHRGARRSG